MPPDSSLRWSLVIPVKVLSLARPRLTGLAGPRRAELALAMAADTVAAASACAVVDSVVVVTDDAAAAALLSGLGALVVPDEPGDGLNPALTFGAARADRFWPGRGRAGLAPDLPARPPAELGRALTEAAGVPQAFVADAAGTGTTLYTARPGTAFWPRFGTGSRAAHLSGGVVELQLSGLDGLRRGVEHVTDPRGPRPRGLVAAPRGA